MEDRSRSRSFVFKKSNKHQANIGQTSLYNMAVLGAEKCGKTTLIHQLVNNQFLNIYQPTISEVYETTCEETDDYYVTFRIYDTAGSIDFPPMTRLTLSKCDGCLIMISVDQPHSIDYARIKLEEIKLVNGDKFPCMLIANKTDIKTRKFFFKDGLDLSLQYNIMYVETSLKEDNISKRIFHTLLKLIRTRHGERSRVESRTSMPSIKTNSIFGKY